MTLSAFDLSPGVSDFRVCLLLAAFGIVAGQHRVRGDDQGAAEKTDTSPIAERIGAVDVRTGTGELADSLEKSLGLPRGTGVFLGGVWVADANCVLSGGADPSKWSSTGSLSLEPALMRRNWSDGQAAASASSFCSSTVSTQINKLAVCRDTIRCPVPRHYIGRNFINCGGGRSSSTESSSSASEKWCQRLISIMFCAPFRCRTNPFSFPQSPASFSRLFS
jgi:hypothetical protein